MKAKKRLTVASAVFAGINLFIFVALFVLLLVFKNDVSDFCVEQVKGLGTESDFGYWLKNAVKDNMGVIMLLFIIVLFLIVVSKFALFYQFVKYARYCMKDFYTRRSKYTTLVLLQILLIKYLL